MGDIDNKKKVSPPSTFKIILNDGQTYGDEYSDAKDTFISFITDISESNKDFLNNFENHSRNFCKDSISKLPNSVQETHKSQIEKIDNFFINTNFETDRKIEIINSILENYNIKGYAEKIDKKLSKVEINKSKDNKVVNVVKIEEFEQETLVEAAEKWVFQTNDHKWSNNDGTAGDNYGSFIAGAKWQTQRMYNEEEVYELLCQFFDDHVNAQDANIAQWFEQNKKK